MKKTVLFFLMFLIVPVVYSGDGEYVKFHESTPVEQPVKEGWWDFAKRHTRNVIEQGKSLARVTAAGLQSMHPGLDEEGEENEPDQYHKKTSSVHLGFKHNDHVPFNFAIEHATNDSGKAQDNGTSQPKIDEKLDQAQKEEKNAQSKASSKSWIQSFKDLFKIDLDVEPDADDWDADLKVSEEDLAKLPDDHEKLRIKPCKLTPESHAKISKIDSWLNSWSFLPVKTAMRVVFPVNELSELIAELNSTGTMPADVGEKIENITKKIRLLPEGMQKALNAAAMTKVLPAKEALAYAGNVLPVLSGLAHAGVDLDIAHKVWELHPDDPMQALKEIHDLGLKTFEKIPMEKIIKAAEGKTKAVDKTKKINGIVTNVAVILFALSLGSLVLSIIEGVTDNKKVRKVMEYLMIIDIAAILGGIGYGATRLGHALNKKAKIESDEASESNQENNEFNENEYEDVAI